MATTVKRTVIGMTKFKGDVDGKHHDNCKVYILVNLDPSQGRMRGQMTMEYKTTQTSELYDRFANVKLPAEFDIDLEEFSNKKQVIQMITDMRPVNAAASTGKASF